MPYYYEIFDTIKKITKDKANRLSSDMIGEFL